MEGMISPDQNLMGGTQDDVDLETVWRLDWKVVLQNRATWCPVLCVVFG